MNRCCISKRAIPAGRFIFLLTVLIVLPAVSCGPGMVGARAARKLRILGVDCMPNHVAPFAEKFVRVKPEKHFGSVEEWVENSRVSMTDREKTIVDCLDRPRFCGGIIEVAKGIRDDRLDRDRLMEYAQRLGNSGVLRRLGYLSESLSIDMDIPKPDTRNYLWLDPTMPHTGPKIAKWRLMDNLGTVGKISAEGLERYRERVA